MTVFGQIVDASVIEARVELVCRRWLPTYVAEVERQRGMTPGALPMPRSWTRRADFRRWPEKNLPAVLVMCPGTSSVSKATGLVGATFVVLVGVIAKGVDEAGASRNAKVYGAAVAALMLQRATREGVGAHVELVSLDYDEMPDAMARTASAAVAAFDVQVDDVIDPDGGTYEDEPPVDPLDPIDDWPIVETVHVDAENEEVA